ncbi:MAG: hypothetical protein AB7V13_17640 [Pseudorhodoplanes sp.]|uniref:hypothetical protein n=1 Tax=Pseudorhodoplanes sp. TaxID=1934341 RepID=UPI003D100E26
MSEAYQRGANRNSGSDSGRSYEAADAGRNRSSNGGRNSFGGTREKLKGFANAQKDAGLDQVESLAEATHKAAESLDGKNTGIAGLLHEAADGLDRMSQSFRDRDVDEIYGSLHAFARRQPLTFMVGSFAAGLFLARFLKTSDEQARRAEPPYHRSPSL